MAKISITKITSVIYKYAMYVHMLFCFVDAIID